jgi:hypothetical protein
MENEYCSHTRFNLNARLPLRPQSNRMINLIRFKI